MMTYRNYDQDHPEGYVDLWTLDYVCEKIYTIQL